MAQIEGFVSIGTGGMVNSATASGTVYGALPGQATAAVPTGWQGGFSGTIGLYGAGVQAIQRVGTGQYAVLLSDDYVRLDSFTIQPVGNGTAVDYSIKDHTVGFGNSIQTGPLAAFVSPGNNPKNTIFINFVSPTAAAIDLDKGAGFFIDLRLRDSMAGPQ